MEEMECKDLWVAITSVNGSKALIYINSDLRSQPMLNGQMVSHGQGLYLLSRAIYRSTLFVLLVDILVDCDS